MTQPAKSQEPSMEEILASIRRLIADDDASKSAPRPAEVPKPVVRPIPSPPPRIMPEDIPAAVHTSPEPAEPMTPSAFDEPAEEEEEESSDILALTESMAASAFEPTPQAPSHPQVASAAPAPSEIPQFRKIEAFSDVAFDETDPKPEYRHAAPRNEAAAAVRSEPEKGLRELAKRVAVDS